MTVECNVGCNCNGVIAWTHEQCEECVLVWNLYVVCMLLPQQTVCTCTMLRLRTQASILTCRRIHLPLKSTAIILLLLLLPVRHTPMVHRTQLLVRPSLSLYVFRYTVSQKTGAVFSFVTWSDIDQLAIESHLQRSLIGSCIPRERLKMTLTCVASVTLTLLSLFKLTVILASFMI